MIDGGVPRCRTSLRVLSKPRRITSRAATPGVIDAALRGRRAAMKALRKSSGR